MQLHLNKRQYLEFENIVLGVFMPLGGFMNRDALHSVAHSCQLPDGELFPVPVLLDVEREMAKQIEKASVVELVYDGGVIGEIIPEDIFEFDRNEIAQCIFGTVDVNHPGVAMFFAMAPFCVGGKVNLHGALDRVMPDHELTPTQCRAKFAELGWHTIVGFQTRNVPHRAHEYLQRTALEQVDGLFIQPLIGWKKSGDFSTEAIVEGYRSLIENYYPANRVLLGTLSTFMRYAGPREAMFHAIIRRNYGCTHFIVGRDHAGVGDYYGKYEAHEFTKKYDGKLGIEVMRMHGPYYCAHCDGIVTEHTCRHWESAPHEIIEISGTDIRAMLKDGIEPDQRLIRPEVVARLRNISLFVSEDSQ